MKTKSNNVEEIKRYKILPVTNIMNKSIIDDDIDTFKVGLDELEKLNLYVFDLKINSESKLKIINYYSGKIFRLIDTAFKQHNEDFIIEIADSLKNIGKTSIEMRWAEISPEEKAKIRSDRQYRSGIVIPDKMENYDKISNEIKSVLSDAQTKAIAKKWGRATRSLLNVRGNLQVTSHNELVLDIRGDIFKFSNDFSRLSNEDKVFSLDYFIEAVSYIVIELINKEIYFDEWYYDSLIKEILKSSLQLIDEEECFRVARITEHLTDMGIEAANNDHKFKDKIIEAIIEVANFDKCSNWLISRIGNEGLGLAYVDKKLETIWICSCLKKIGNIYLQKSRDESSSYIFDFLEGIENNFRVKKSSDMLEITLKIIEIIKDLGDKSIHFKLEKSSKNAINSLIQIGMMSENIDIKKEICEILKNMQTALQNKKIFKSVLEINGKVEDNKLVKFQEFKKFCNFNDG